MSHMFRRTGCLIMLTALSLVSGACSPMPPVSRAETLPTLFVGTQARVKHAGILMAAANGYFTQEGITVEFRTMPGHREAIAALQSGEIDIYPFGAFYALEAIAKGGDIYIFGGTMWEGTEILALAGGDSQVVKAEDLRGARIASASTEAGCLVLRQELERQGLAGEVTIVYVTDDAQGIAGLRSGDFDYYLCNNATGYYARALGLRVAGTVNTIVPDYPCCTLESSRAAYTGKRDALVRFMRAVLRGFEDYYNDPQGTVEAIADFTGIDADFTRASLYGKPDYRNVMRLDPALEPEILRLFYDALLKDGLISGDAPLAGHVVTDIWEEAQTFRSIPKF